MISWSGGRDMTRPVASIKSMRLRRLEISNFKAVAHFVIEDGDDAVVLAGSRHSGVSASFELLRSVTLTSTTRRSGTPCWLG